MTETRIEQVRAERRRLENEFAPKIAAARQEVEEVEAAFEDVRRRRNEAVDRHKKLTDRYEYERVLVGNPGGGRA